MRMGPKLPPPEPIIFLSKPKLVVPPLDYVLPRPDFAVMYQHTFPCPFLPNIFCLPVTGILEDFKRFADENVKKRKGEKIHRIILVELSNVSLFSRAI